MKSIKKSLRWANRILFTDQLFSAHRLELFWDCFLFNCDRAIYDFYHQIYHGAAIQKPIYIIEPKPNQNMLNSIPGAAPELCSVMYLEPQIFTELSSIWKHHPTQRGGERGFQAFANVFSALHLGGHGSSELLLFKSQWFRCHQRFQRDCIWSLYRLVINLRIHGHKPCSSMCSLGWWDRSLSP